MMNKLSDVASLDIPATLKALAVGMAPLASFFGVNLLWALLAFLVIDWLTGLRKAALMNKVASYKFGTAVDRAVYYLVVFAVLHVITLFVPLGTLAPLPEALVLTAYTLKEALSILENLRSIQALRGGDTRVADAIIQRLGMDFNKLVDEITPDNEAANKDAGRG